MNERSDKCLSATEPYSFHIRSVFVTDRLWFRIRIRTLSAPIPNPKKIGNEYGFTTIRPYPGPFSPLIATVYQDISSTNYFNCYSATDQGLQVL
jgi:hypothetical protein